MRKTGDGLQWLRNLQLAALQERVNEMEARFGVGEKAQALRERAAQKIATGSNLTREEVAAHLGVSVKTVQRMEADGVLRRCPGLRGAVLYAARDVLRLAPAPRRER